MKKHLCLYFPQVCYVPVEYILGKEKREQEPKEEEGEDFVEAEEVKKWRESCQWN